MGDPYSLLLLLLSWHDNGPAATVAVVDGEELVGEGADDSDGDSDGDPDGDGT